MVALHMMMMMLLKDTNIFEIKKKCSKENNSRG
jgi:hypothetical protein